MKFLLLYFGGYKKNIIFRIIIFIQVLIAAIAINLALGNFEFTKQLEKIPSNGMKISGVVISSTAERNNNIDESVINETIKKLPEIEDLGRIDYSSARFSENKDSISLLSYPEFMLNSLNDFKLSKGNENDYGFHDGVNYVFASSDSFLEYGKEYQCNIFDNNNKWVNVKIKITGIYNANVYILNLNSQGNYNSFRSIYRNENQNSIVSTDIRDTSGNIINLQSQTETFVKLRQGVDFNNVRKTWEKDLQGHAGFSTLKELIDLSRNEDFEKGKSSYSIAIVLILICLIGMGSGAIIKIINESKEYGIYFMCGQVWSKCITANVLSNVIDILIPFTLGLLIAKYMSGDSLIHSLLTLNNILISLLLIITIFVITGFWSIIYLAKTSPISFLRRNKS